MLWGVTRVPKEGRGGEYTEEHADYYGVDAIKHGCPLPFALLVGIRQTSISPEHSTSSDDFGTLSASPFTATFLVTMLGWLSISLDVNSLFFANTKTNTTATNTTILPAMAKTKTRRPGGNPAGALRLRFIFAFDFDGPSIM